MFEDEQAASEWRILYRALEFNEHESAFGRDSWSVNTKATVDNLHRAGYRIVQVSDEDEPINYDGPDPSVECAYLPCTNRLLRASSGGDQWCSEAHRDFSENHLTSVHPA